MIELFRTIPDPRAVLALEPEELGAILLLMIRQRGEEESFSINNLVGEIRYSDESRGISGYPREKWGELELAISEAFAWLESQALLIADPRSVGTSWRVLSRRARRFENREDVRQFQMARRLNRDLLHPTIAEKVWLAFIRGDFPEAVFTAMRAVEISVREAGKLEQKQVGTKLMQAAFGQSGPLRDREADTAEEDGLMHLFIGAMGSYKNPHSHRNVAMEDPVETMEIVMLASHLLRIVDARR